jgi:wyosine [tRNA(Phe)-imidazoG37] synthetase (radical SAM superfamily)
MLHSLLNPAFANAMLRFIVADSPTSFSQHSRRLGENRYVYAVLARRSKGLSVGVNLNPDKICNWDCIYCQVDRAAPALVRSVDLDTLGEELGETLALAKSGELYRSPRFEKTPPEMRRLSDIAFAGDGEPTSYPKFDEAIELAIAVKRETGWPDLPIKVLTNATLLDRPAVSRGLDRLAEDGGEIWAKLDAGTEEFFQRVDRPHHTLERCVELITAEARKRPVVIQSLLMRIDGAMPGDSELAAWIGRLRAIREAGGAIRLLQVTTVARRPAESNVAMIEDAELDAIADRVRREIPGLAVETYHGVEFEA